MRPIKFRLIYKGKIVGYEIHFVNQGVVRIIHSATNLSLEEILNLWKKENLKFGLRYKHDSKQQFIGSHDKNGKEIYEDDIIITNVSLNANPKEIKIVGTTYENPKKTNEKI